MRLTVTFYQLNPGTARSEVAGHLVWDGKKITPSDDSILLRNILAQSVEIHTEKIDPKKQPERWMRNLWQMYRSPYLQALKAAIE
jgi:hypothetical protein